MIALVLSLLILSIDITVIFRGYDMPSWNAPLCSIEAFEAVKTSICAYFGFSAAQKVNFLNLLAATPLFLQSAQSSLFGNGYSMLILWLFAAAAAVWAMMMPAKRMFVK